VDTARKGVLFGSWRPELTPYRSIISKICYGVPHFGLLANRAKKQDLGRCRELLGAAASPPAAHTQSPRELLLAISGIDLARCPVCWRGQMVVVGELPGDGVTTARCEAARAPALDSS
jgi:hypothetical protein